MDRTTSDFIVGGDLDWSVLLASPSCGTWRLDEFRNKLRPAIEILREGGHCKVKLAPGNMTSYEIHLARSEYGLIVAMLNGTHRVYEFPLGHELHPSYVSQKLDQRDSDAAVLAAVVAVIREGLG